MKAAQYHPESPQERVEGISLLFRLESRNGFVFLIARIQKNNADTETLFQILSDQLHRLVESFGTQANAQHRFEQFLGALNETLAEHVRDGRFHVPIQQVDAMVGIASDDKMFLSGTGDLSALFLHRKPSQRYQLFNLFRSIQTEQSLPTWEKAFAVVLDGDLHEGDVFCISNQDLQRAIVADELNMILTTLPPAGAIEKIRQYFSHRIGLLLIVIKLTETPEKLSVAETKIKPQTQVSLSHLKDQEDQTQRLLEDQTPKIGSLLRIIKGMYKKFIEKEMRVILSKYLRKTLWHALKITAHVKTKNARVEITRRLIQKASTLHKKTFISIKSLMRLRRSTAYLIAGMITVCVILVVGISTLASSRAKMKDQRIYVDQIETITDLIERADGAVIYKDENQARGLFINASTLVDQLPTDTPERAQKKIELLSTIQKSTDEIRHLISVPNPALLGDLSSFTDGVFGQSFVRVGQEMYVFASDGRVYQLDRTQKGFKPVSSQIEGDKIATSASADYERIYALMTNQEIFEFKKNEAIQEPLNLIKPDETFVDLMAYADRLYVLATTQTDGQIYRFGRSAETFSSGTRWITSKTSILTDARSITIDGTVYVLQKNGNITRFENGSQIEWNTGVVDPPITNATDLWTDQSSAFLYVIEPDTKRTIVFDKKTGAFVVQYRSESFQNLSDILVDEASYAIYLLSGSKIYSIAPSHIGRE